MKFVNLFTVGIAIFAGFYLQNAPVFGQTAQARWAGSCQVTFSGNSTLHAFSGKVKAEPFVLAVENPDDPAKARISGKVIVQVEKMVSDNKKRDKKMHECMNAKRYPEIVVTVENLMASATSPKKGKVPQPTEIPFTMALNGKLHQKVAKVSNWSYNEKNITCTLAFPVSLAKSGITPPTVLGVVKVDDTIEISANLSLVRK